MNNEPRGGDEGSGLAIAPSGLRIKRASYRGFASTLTASRRAGTASPGAPGLDSLESKDLRQ